ncbi:MAG: GTP-binding protein [Thiohalorhabdus sp.]|uniref:GTP-binding protein n=1 Tax=Thiohalorhabdus sp. TaxID=3094134 RepID=UPI0039801C65
MSEIKLVFAGPTGAGKTEAISQISEKPPLSTDLSASDEVALQKATTTVAMDFGELTLPGGEKLHLYGTPGQERFAHMWPILARGSLGIILLIDHTARDPAGDLELYLRSFRDLIEETGIVIGVTRSDLAPELDAQPYYDRLAEQGLDSPVLFVDPREQQDVLMLVDTLLALLEFQ